MLSPDQLFARLAARRPALRRALPLALLLPPFAFALADPARSLAAMFLMFGLAVWTVMGQARPGWLILVATLAYLVAAAFPYCFSPLAYVIGVACFVLAGEGAMQR